MSRPNTWVLTLSSQGNDGAFYLFMRKRFSKSVKNVKLKRGRLRGPSCSPSAFIEDIKRSSEGERSAFYCSGAGEARCVCATSHSYFLSLCNLQCATTCVILYMLSYFILTSDLCVKHYFLNIEEET